MRSDRSSWGPSIGTNIFNFLEKKRFFSYPVMVLGLFVREFEFSGHIFTVLGPVGRIKALIIWF